MSKADFNGVYATGGTGNMVAYLQVQYDISKTMYTGQSTATSYLAGHMDQHDPNARHLEEERSESLGFLSKYDKEQQFPRACPSIHVDNLTDLNQAALQLEGDAMDLNTLAQREGGAAPYLVKMYFPAKDSAADTKEGYKQSGAVGSIHSSVSFNAQFRQKDSVLRNIVDQVDQGNTCRVIVLLSTTGAESKAHGPAVAKGLYQKCLDNAKKKDPEHAESYVRDHLQIVLILIGTGMGVPASPKGGCVNTNYAAVNAQVLEQLPNMDILDKVSAVYYAALPESFIQAEKYVEGWDQKRHPSVMLLCVVDCINRSAETDFADLNALWVNGIPKVQIAPLAAMAPPERYSWDNLGFQPAMKKILLSRVCFAACLLLAVAPNTVEVNEDDLVMSSFLRETFGGKELKRICANEDAKAQLLGNLNLMVARERRFLQTMLDVSTTGSDFSRVKSDGRNFEKTSLLNSRMLQSILDGSLKVNDLTKFDLSELVAYTDSTGNVCTPHQPMTLAEAMNKAEITRHRFWGDKPCGNVNLALKKLYDAVKIS